MARFVAFSMCALAFGTCTIQADGEDSSTWDLAMLNQTKPASTEDAGNFSQTEDAQSNPSQTPYGYGGGFVRLLGGGHGEGGYLPWELRLNLGIAPGIGHLHTSKVRAMDGTPLPNGSNDLSAQPGLDMEVLFARTLNAHRENSVGFLEEAGLFIQDVGGRGTIDGISTKTRLDMVGLMLAIGPQVRTRYMEFELTPFFGIGSDSVTNKVSGTDGTGAPYSEHVGADGSLALIYGIRAGAYAVIIPNLLLGGTIGYEAFSARAYSHAQAITSTQSSQTAEENLTGGGLQLTAEIAFRF